MWSMSVAEMLVTLVGLVIKGKSEKVYIKLINSEILFSLFFNKFILKFPKIYIP